MVRTPSHSASFSFSFFFFSFFFLFLTFLKIKILFLIIFYNNKYNMRLAGGSEDRNGNIISISDPDTHSLL